MSPIAFPEGKNDKCKNGVLYRPNANMGAIGHGMRIRRSSYKEIQLPEPCKSCEKLDDFILPSVISEKICMIVGKYKSGDGAENVAVQKSRGVIETYLKPDFINGGDCPEIDSEKWAIDYTYKRNRPALHKGIDIPQPRGFR